MTKLFLGLAVTFASVTGGVAVDQMLSRGHKLNFLLAVVLAALVGVALVMPGDW